MNKKKISFLQEKKFSSMKNFPLQYKLKLIFLSGTCLLILLKYMENLEYSGQKKLRKSILACIRERKNYWKIDFRIEIFN
jgi:hypothetical protein